jgi:protein TonB
MFQETKWFGVSLALHLAVAIVLVFTASRTADRTPKAIMVVLDNLALPDPPQDKPAKEVTRQALPARQPETVKAETTRPLPQSVPPLAVSSPVQAPARDLQKNVPDEPVRAVVRPRAEASNQVPAAAVKAPAQTSAPSAAERPTPEKVQQRYLKEHFAYIRDLITKQLVYPPMARRMNWSGKVVLAFVIAEDGAVHNIRVVETSGFPTLDRSAADTVRNAAPFPRPPVRAEIVVPVYFKLM